MTVVVLILALLASLTLPRLVTNRRRVLQLAAEQVADLLLMFAQRDSLSQTPVGILHDPDRNWIYLMRLEKSDDPLLQGGSVWVADAAVKPVKMPDFLGPADVQFRADGQTMYPQDWPLSNRPGRDRPTLEILLQSPDRETVVVSLAPHAVAPRIAGLGERAELRAEPIDLDTMGRAREEW